MEWTDWIAGDNQALGACSSLSSHFNLTATPFDLGFARRVGSSGRTGVFIEDTLRSVPALGKEGRPFGDSRDLITGN
jgi:hypothetical protein